MKRRLKVLATLETLCADHLTPASLENYPPIGFTADQVAIQSGLCRSNTSSDLNALHREGAVIKILGRPTYYLAVSWVERILPQLKGSVPRTVRHHRELLEPMAPLSSVPRPVAPAPSFPETGESVFANLIGAQGSLKTAVEQAKAAVLYPPKGLDTMLVGPTGVGKTMFAEYMYRFAQSEGRIRPGGQLVVFNCADYANNPQLLLSQLFGHVRGAFTGADREKAGLVERADGGILFLDEIHRMPPEGQEMLFYLLDKGEFRRMGEVDAKRKVTLMLVGATTEDPDSVLLKTFLRRIPMVIHLPELAARPLSERFSLIQFLLAREAAHIQADVVVDREALWALLLYHCPGNIGQLRNDLQLVCAKAFLQYVRAKQYVRIDADTLPPKIKQAAVQDPRRRLEASRILGQIGHELVVRAAQPAATVMEDDKRILPVDFYQQLNHRVNFLERQGLSQEEVIKCIEVDIDQYFRQLYPESEPPFPDYLQKLLPPAFVATLDKAFAAAQAALGKTLSSRLYYALAIHIAASLERIRNGQRIVNPKLSFIIENYPREYSVAATMAEMIGAYAETLIPPEEIGFIALMLATLEEMKDTDNRRVGVMVLAHGKATANNLVDFANKMLGVDHGRAIDMPLEAGIEDIFDQAVALAREIDQGKGIVLLVDMGSLCAVGSAITQQTGIPVKTVDMVSTVMVLHALHKAILPNTSLDEVYEAVWELRSAMQAPRSNPDIVKDKAILATCFTGQGAAHKIKEWVEDILARWHMDHIRVIPLEAADKEFLHARLPVLLNAYEVVASVGAVDPALPGIPHITLEALLHGGAGSQLRQVLNTGGASFAGRYSDHRLEREALIAVIARTLDEFLTFVNPRKVLSAVLTCTRQVEETLGFTFSHSGLMRMVIHTGCMVERLLTGASLGHPGKDRCMRVHSAIYEALRQAILPVEQTFGIRVSEDELCYLVDMILLEPRQDLIHCVNTT